MKKVLLHGIELFVILLIIASSQAFAQLQNFFSMRNQATDTILIQNTFLNNDTIFPFTENTIITSMAFSGTITHSNTNSLIRVILIDSLNNEFLIIESYPLLSDSLFMTYDSFCEETALLNNIKPYYIRIEVFNGSLYLDKLILSSINNYNFSQDTANKIHKNQTNIKINKVNNGIQVYNLEWTADSTWISDLWFREKKDIVDSHVFLQGIEFYGTGIYDWPGSLKGNTYQGSWMIDNFDWRDKHQARNSNSPYFNDSADSQGWLTSVKDQGWTGNCHWFSVLAVVEAMSNLYFNQFIHPDLSEQDYISCGLHLGPIFVSDSGVINEECFPYAGISAWDTEHPLPPCSNQCASPVYKVRPFNNYKLYQSQNISFPENLDPVSEDSIKTWLIKYGPLDVEIPGHATCLLGFYYDYENNRTLYIVKDAKAYGSGGYNLVLRTEAFYGMSRYLTPISMTGKTESSIRCLDLDHDGYYNWGIGPKPPQCPLCPDLEDCDDSDPNLGPMDVDGSCSHLLPVTMSFESSTLLDWKQSRTDNFNWTINFGGTPTEDTGPDSAFDGHNYAYIEATNNNPSEKAEIISPSIYLKGDCHPQLSYAYHMYGHDIDSLYVKVSEDAGVTWSKSLGIEQGNKGDKWNFKQIDLTDYNGKMIKIKFTATTGLGDKGDIAIDDVLIGSRVTLSSNSPICAHDTIKLFMHGIQGKIIHWSGPNGFTSIDVNPIINNADTSLTGWYNCSVTDTCGFKVSDSTYIEVKFCCSDTNIKLFSNIYTSSIVNLPPKFAISGVLNVDNSFTINSQSDITMLPNASINIVNGESLFIYSSHIHGCNQLWNTINVQDSASLVIDKSLIEDAQYAITANSHPDLSITKNHFNRNYIGLYFPQPVDSLEMRIYNNLRFSGNEFECDTLNLLAPRSSENSFAGAYIYNFKEFSLFGSSQNYYHHMRNGIVAYNTNLIVENSKFGNISDTSLTMGAAIYHETKRYISPCFLTVDGSTVTNGVLFHDCLFGISGSKVNTNIKYTKMYNVNIGIQIMGSQYCDQIINHNLFYCTGLGVFLWHNDPVNKVDINNNTFMMYGRTYEPSAAVYTAEWRYPPVDTCIIHNNSIQMDTCTFGIRMYCTDASQVYENNVHMDNPNVNAVGITPEGCDFSNVHSNWIWGTDPYLGDTVKLWPKGMRALSSQTSKFSCNVMGDLLVGFSCENICTGDSIQGNIFNDHRIGLHYDKNAMTGDQKNCGNMWLGSYSGFGAQHESNDPQIINQSIYSVQPWFPYQPPSVNVSGWFYPITDTVTYTCSSYPYLWGDSMSPAKLSSFDHEIAKGNIKVEGFENESKWQVARYLYDKIVINNINLSNDTLIQHYYDSINSASPGQFQQVDMLSKQAVKPTLTAKTQLKFILNSIQRINDSVSRIDSLLFTGISLSDSILLCNLRENQLSSLGVFQNLYSTSVHNITEIKLQNNNSVLIQNEVLPSSDIYEQNEKMLNDIYLNTIAIGILKFTPYQKYIISDIANQCPLAGGKAVYKARGIQSLIKDSIYDDKLLCSLAGYKNTPNKEPKKVKSNHNFVIVPNPASDIINVKWDNPVDENATFTLADQLGQILVTKQFSLNELVISISTNDMVSGIYHVCIKTTDGKMDCKKLVLIKK